MGTSASTSANEEALQAFLRSLPASVAPRARALAHAWTAADGDLQVGRMTVRLVATASNGRPFTAATLHANHAGGAGGPALELARVLLFNHGVTNADWTSWSDELTDLQAHGFAAGDKYPTVALADLPDPIAVRLAQGLRDLGRLAQGQAA